VHGTLGYLDLSLHPLSLFMVNICGHQTEHLRRTALHPSALLSYPHPRNDRHIYYSASRLWVSQTCSSISSLGRYWFFAKEYLIEHSPKMSSSFKVFVVTTVFISETPPSTDFFGPSKSLDFVPGPCSRILELAPFSDLATPRHIYSTVLH
jgi:hypothetical protein